MMARLRVWEVVSVLSVLAAMGVSAHAFAATVSAPISAQSAADFEVSDQNKAALGALLRNASLQALSDDSGDEGASEGLLQADSISANSEGQPAGEASGPFMNRILNRQPAVLPQAVADDRRHMYLDYSDQLPDQPLEADQR